MANPYIDVASFRLRTIMPQPDVDLLEANEPGYLGATLDDWAAHVEARLSKRYDVSRFSAPIPRVIPRWITKCTTPDAYRKRGCNPNDPQLALAEQDRELALTEIKEAADSKDGLFELPLKGDAPNVTGIERGGPFGYSEASPYVAFDQQADEGRQDDIYGRGR